MKRRNKLKMYLPFATNVFQRLLSYKANVIIFLIGEFMMLAVSYYLWKAIYRSSSSATINGFSLNQMIIYILISFLTSLIISVDILSDVYKEVRDGSIAINLIRPISYEKRMMFQALGNVMYNFTLIFIVGFIGISVLFYSYTGSLSIINILLYLASTIIGVFINFYYSYCFALLSFKITNMWGLSQIMQAITQLLSGALIPIVFFPKILQKVIEVLPFSSAIYTPSMIYLGKLTGTSLIKALSIQIFWMIVLSIVAKVMWNGLIKKLTILGG
ncbi:ABC transporter permease [Clostridium hydrogenum]|uniref:ABC transporter permease n=1 Tax=Clostridium hydrogenum TaxID=2855764 RepID=UPI002E313939|nr:ABC-2 family transporter protein [Clostridium hydrogenum]